jgi:predicted transcriptional regulator
MKAQDSFGTAMRHERQRLGLKQVALAKLVGLSQPKIADLEANRRTCGRDVAERIANALRITGGNREQFIASAIGTTTVGKVSAIQTALERCLRGEIFSIEHEVPIGGKTRADMVVTMKDGRRCAVDLKYLGEWKDGKFVECRKIEIEQTRRR